VRINRFLFLICAATAPALINLPATELVSQTAKNLFAQLDMSPKGMTKLK